MIKEYENQKITHNTEREQLEVKNNQLNIKVRRLKKQVKDEEMRLARRKGQVASEEKLIEDLRSDLDS